MTIVPCIVYIFDHGKYGKTRNSFREIARVTKCFTDSDETYCILFSVTIVQLIQKTR